MRQILLLLFLPLLGIPGCAPPIAIPEDGDADRIEIRDQNAMHSYEDLLKPTKTITDPQQISEVLEFVRQRNRFWAPPLFETPVGRYTAGFYNGEKFQFVLLDR